MGRQRKRINHKAKKASAPASFQETAVKQVLHRQPLEDYQDELTQNEADEICNDLSEALKQIYGEFVNDLRSRKKKRMDSDTPLEPVQEYKLIVQGNYRKQYAAKVSLLVNAGYGEQAFSQLRENIVLFVNSLREETVKVPNPALRGKVLEDAYHTLKNASEEVGKIVKVLFYYERDVNCEGLNKFHFYELVVKVVKQCQNEESEILTNSATSIENDLNLDQISTEPQLNFSALQEHKVWELQISDSEDDEESSVKLALSKMTIEELIVFIENSSATNSTKKRRNKGSTRSSSPKEAGGDSELETLIAILKNAKPATHKVKPNLKPEWLQKLRSEFFHKG